MYDRILNESRASLTTNNSSSRVSRLVRKRDNNLMVFYNNRSRPKTKPDEDGDNYEYYINRQAKIFDVDNVEDV
jgi:hypothetical protein